MLSSLQLSRITTSPESEEDWSSLNPLVLWTNCQPVCHLTRVCVCVCVCVRVSVCVCVFVCAQHLTRCVYASSELRHLGGLGPDPSGHLGKIDHAWLSTNCWLFSPLHLVSFLSDLLMVVCFFLLVNIYSFSLSSY